MPPMPEGSREGILKGMYVFRARRTAKSKLRAQLFGSGAILREAIHAQEILEEKYGVAADVWSVTSYKALYTMASGGALEPAASGTKPRVPYVTQCLADEPGVLVAASDYLKALPNLVTQWMPRRFATLGTDGFGRSEGRTSLRDFFEVDAGSSRWHAARAAARREDPGSVVEKAIKVANQHRKTGSRFTV